MPKSLIVFLLAFSDVLLLLGCQGPSKAVREGFAISGYVTTQPAVDLILEPLDPSFDDDTMNEWGAEAIQRFGGHTVVVGCHGWYAVNGDWLVMPKLLNPIENSDRPWPVENLIKYEEAEHPGYKIVFLCCNVDSVVLHGYPDVWYSPNEVWVTPDAFCSPNHRILRALRQSKVVGDIKGFVSAK